MSKSLLRGLKADGSWRLKILFSPILIPTWLIDILFKLRLYIKDFEDASRPKDIKFYDYDKYIHVDTDDSDYIEKILKSFHNDYDPKVYNYTINGADIKLTQQDEFTLLKIEKNIDFNSFNTFNTLIQYIDNSAPLNRVYHVKGILIHKQHRSDSYFCFVDTAYPLKLIGKTYRNKKMYVDFDPEKKDNEKIYFNSNIDYFKNFKFDTFESELEKLKFKNIEIMPMHNKQH
jgi:uncharacterized protein YeeX (DUF496 family)